MTRAILAKDLAEKDARARDNKRFTQGRVLAVNSLNHTVRVQVNEVETIEDVPYTAQTPPNVGDIGDLVYSSSSIHSVRFTNPRLSSGNNQGDLTVVGGVTTLRKAGAALLKGAVTLSEGSGVSLTQVGQDIEIAAILDTSAVTELAQDAINAALTLGPIDGLVVTYDDGGNALGLAVKQRHVLVLCAAFTPVATGVDLAQLVVPYHRDGTTVKTYTVRRISFRVGTAGGAPAVTVQKYTGTGSFSPTTVGTVTLGSGAYEGAVTSALGTVDSGDKIRFNVDTLATAETWTIEVEIGE